MKYILYLLIYMLAIFPVLAQTDSIYQTENVVITGQYQPTDIRNALHQIKLISAAEIEKRGAVNIAEVLAQESNIRIQNDPVLGTNMSINGLSGRNIKFLLNGVPIVGRQNGNIDLSQINVYTIQRIEIIEGPMAVMYGADAIGGVVNIITKQYNTKKWEYSLALRGETRAAQVGNTSLSFQPNAQNTLRLSGQYSQFKGWAIDSSRDMRWNPKKQGNGQFSWLYQNKKNIKLLTSFDAMSEVVDNVGEVRRPQFKPYAFDEKYTTNRIQANVNLDIPMGEKHFFSLVMGANRYFRQKDNYRIDLTTEEKQIQYAEQDTSIFDMAMLRATHSWQLNKKISVQSGINAQIDMGIGKRFADTSQIKTRNMQDYAIFLATKWQVNSHLSGELAMRTSYNTRFSIPIIPSLHVKYLLPKYHTNLRASYARGFRAPDFKELYFQFIDFNHNIVGNETLKPEDAHTLQLSSDTEKTYKKHKWNYGTRLFFNQIRDKIDLYEYIIGANGEKIPVTDSSTLLYSYFNIENYQNLGGTVHTKWQNNWLNIGVSSTFTGYLTPNYRSYKVPRYTWAIDMQGELGIKIPKTSTMITIYNHWNDKQISYYYENINGENMLTQRKIKGFLATDVVLGQRFWKEKIHLAAGVRNLFNVQQLSVIGTNAGQGHVSETQINIGTGRSLWTQLSFHF